MTSDKKCPDCDGPLEWLETRAIYDRYTCENRCNGENSWDAHYCKFCGDIMEGEFCCVCDECGKPCAEQFCSEACKKDYHAAYKHHGEDAARIAYEENKYNDFYEGIEDDFQFEADWDE